MANPRHPKGARTGKLPVAAEPVAVAPVTAPNVLAHPVPPVAAPVLSQPAPPATKPVAEPALVVPPVMAATIAPPAAVPADRPAKEDIMDTTTIDQTAQTATNKAQAMFGDVTARAQDAMEKSKKMFEDMGGFGKDNIEAIVESSKIAAKGLESMGQDAASYAKTSFEGVSEAVKTLAAVKSPTEFMKLQNDYVRTAFDAMVAQTSRSTEAMLKLAGEVAQPISNRMSVAAEKIKIAA